MSRTLSEAVEDFHSPSWPYPMPSMSDLSADIDAFMADGTTYSREVVADAFIRFWAERANHLARARDARDDAKIEEWKLKARKES